MTIYAIVNDLLAHDEAIQTSGPIWTLISPSGILQGGNPYFVPDFASRFEARTATAVRIGKLGKGIAPRFASRYVDAAAPAVVFVASDRLESLRCAGLPWSSALSYDRCLAIGKFQPMAYDEIAQCRCAVCLQAADSAEPAVCYNEKSTITLEETIAALSRDNTLKTGDIILTGLSGHGPEVKPEMRARLMINGETGLGFNIR